jgi:hypothetical protein
MTPTSRPLARSLLLAMATTGHSVATTTAKAAADFSFLLGNAQ